MRKRNHEGAARARLLVLVDESNIGSSVRTAGRDLDWLKLRDFLAGLFRTFGMKTTFEILRRM